jgi:hypothetical protein
MAPVQPSVSVAATGLGIRYLGDYAYAFSGLVACDDSGVSLLDFTTGSGIISGKFQFLYASSSTDAYNYIVEFNGEEVIHYRVFGSTDTNGEHQLPSDIPIVIPPFTHIKATSTNVAGNSNSTNQVANLVGRVYGAE